MKSLALSTHLMKIRESTLEIEILGTAQGNSRNRSMGLTTSGLESENWNIPNGKLISTWNSTLNEDL